MKKIRIFASLVLAALLVSCSSGTLILGSWSNPEKKTGGYQDIVVFGISESVISRQTFENQIQTVLNQAGIKASNSLILIPPGTRLSDSEKEKLAKQLKDQGHEAVLTVALLDQTQESRYVPGTTSYAPMMYGGFYRSYWGYYSRFSPVMYEPGYYTTDKNYYLEANLYDVASEQLVWSAQSQTTNPANLESFANSFATTITGQMVRDGILIKK